MSEPLSEPMLSKRIRNGVIAIAALILSVTLFLGLQTQTSSVSLAAQAEKAISVDLALSNQKPTLMEFYADWCTSCQAMARDLSEIKKDYGNEVNFVMLNVDNTKWLPEMLRYRVDGIPHFVFLDSKGSEIAQAIGEQPRSVMEADLDALIADLPLPYTYSTGEISELESQITSQSGNQDDPRAHGAQVQ